MNREIDRSKLVKIVAEEVKVNPGTVDIFVSQLFKEVEKKMFEQSLVRLENLGLFRIIETGKTNRILFLGTTQKGEIKRSASVSERAPVDEEIPATKVLEEITQADSAVQPLLQEPVSDNNRDLISKGEYVKPSVKRHMPRPQSLPDKNIPSVKKRQKSFQERENSVMAQNNQNTNHIGVFRKYRIWFGAVALAVIVSILAIVFIPHQKRAYIAIPDLQQVTVEEDKFKELDNPDKRHISCVIVAQYNISLQQLSKIYYGNEKFWPYLYKANENIVDANYTIPSQSAIKIPKITVDLVELNTGKLDDKLTSLANDIRMK